MRHVHHAILFFASLLAASSIADAQRCDHPLFGNMHLLVPSGPEDVAIADFNDDGFDDIVICGGDYDQIWIHFGRGHGLFGRRHMLNHPAVFGASRLNTGDVNNDGNIDILAVDHIFLSGIVWHNNGGGEFTIPTMPVHSLTTNIHAMPVDANDSLDRVIVCRSRIDVKFFGGTTFRIVPLGTNVEDSVCADMNSDGAIDIVLADRGESAIHVVRNNRDGTLVVHHGTDCC